MSKDRFFTVVDAIGGVYLATRAEVSYEKDFRKHVSWWKRHVKTSEYRKKVHPSRWPVFPVRIQIDECG